MRAVVHQFTSAAALSAALLFGSIVGAAPALAAGYEPIDPPVNTSSGDKVEVVEFFWLGCPHCYRFEPIIEGWAKNDKPDYVEFVREAPPLNPAWENHSRAFYAGQLLNHEDEFTAAMFEAIHEERKAMRDPEDIADLAAEHGMDRDKFLGTMKSFAVETRMRRAMQLARNAGISGVPSVVVNGKYRTGAQEAGGYPQMIEVINERAEAERKDMGLE